MSLNIDISRAFRRTKSNLYHDRKKANTDFSESKIQKLLGLNDDLNGLRRNNSASSASTTKVQSVTFSDATTARVSTVHSNSKLKDLPPMLPELGLKASSVLLREEYENGNRKIPNAGSEPLRSFPSNSSLRSFYDKSAAPLSVSQQTSNSSTRDFALRKGTASILTSTSRGKEHAAQFRILTGSKTKKNKSETGGLVNPEFRPSTTSSKLSNAGQSMISSSAAPTATTEVSLPTSASASRISIVRSQTPSEKYCPVPGVHMVGTDHPFPLKKPVVDPGHRKINVRRPKAGAKNWFDSIEDSSDEEVVMEPQPEQSFVQRMSSVEDRKPTAAPGRPEIPPRSKLRSTSREKLQRSGTSASGMDAPHPLQSNPPSNATSTPSTTTTSEQALTPRSASIYTSTSHSCDEGLPKRRKIDPFALVDLLEQSILCLSSSEDEDEDFAFSTPKAIQQTFLRESLLCPSVSESDFEIGEALAIKSRSPTYRYTAHKESHSNAKPDQRTVPQRSSSRMLTYLNDRSMETVFNDAEILSSFPPTPIESMASKHTSLRDSVISDSQSMMSTRVMTVTKQEESLIAAMRLKKAAMKQSKAALHREGALRILEHGTQPSPQHNSAMTAEYSEADHNQRYAQRHVKAPTQGSKPATRLQIPRSESVTTFQTESLRDPSIRDSYIVESSDELELPYSAMDEAGASMIPASLRRSNGSQRGNRNTFLSTTSSGTTIAPASPSSDWSGRDSHVVILDSLDQQLLREEIPSQLFMEAPFIGWERRAQMVAH